MLPQVLADVTIGEAALIVGVVVALGEGLRRIWPTLRRVVHLIDRFAGDPDAGVPGIVERIGSVEGSLVAIRDELRPNGGSSLRDRIDLHARMLVELRDDLTRHIEESRRAPRRAGDPPSADYRRSSHAQPPRPRQ